MNRIALLWDASHLWGLLVWQALQAFALPCELVKGSRIAQQGLSDKTSLLIVPGGMARHKYEALGTQGREALRQWVGRGGHYLGFCGGAGLGLSDVQSGLGLCPWKRAGFTHRLQHFLSGHVLARLAPGVDASAGDFVPLPVWWPGRFAEQPDTSLSVLARYEGPGSDLYVADFALAALPPSVLTHWSEVYGLSLEPAMLRGEPCVIRGAYGQGGYTLSYSHLETPDSPAANAWLARIIEAYTGMRPAVSLVPPWPKVEPVWEDPGLLACCKGMDELMTLGYAHGLFFARTSWLTGWRPDVPGAGLNSVALALRVLVSYSPTPAATALWKTCGAHFCSTFAQFREGAEANLLARRLAATVPEAVPKAVLAAQRTALFGSAMQEGGLYQRLMDVLDELLFVNLQGRI